MTISASGLGTIFLLGSAAVLPLGTVSPNAVADPAAKTLFAAPDGALVLTRELRRDLSRGKQLLTRRSYRVVFTREGEGWRVDGELIDSQVDAPPELDALAQLEKARAEPGLFPLHLDAAGRIVEQHGGGDAAAAAKAVQVVSGAMATIAMEPRDRATADDMVRRIAVQSQSADGHWPADLFHPAAGRRSEVQALPLPDGSEGRITVTIDALGGGDGTLDHFERNIVTELAGTRRESMEIFRLTRAR